MPQDEVCLLNLLRDNVESIMNTMVAQNTERLPLSIGWPCNIG
jgi:hypothetical protein